MLRPDGDGAIAGCALMLTTFDLDGYVYESLCAAFLLKNSSPEQLLQAIAFVASGDALLDPSVTRRVIERFAQRGAPRRGAGDRCRRLTAREREYPSDHARTVERRDR